MPAPKTPLPGFHAILSLAVAFCGSLLPAQAPVAPESNVPELKVLKQAHDARKMALLQPLTDLKANYRDALERTKDSATRIGNLEAVLAVTQALKDLDAGSPAAPSKAPEVEQFRKIYVQQSKLIGADVAGQTTKAIVDYLEQLRALNQRLIQLNRPEDAKVVAKEEDAAKRELRSLGANSPMAQPAQQHKP